ncbi:transcriptional regulator [Halobacteriales archaeon QS_1_68_20]|nr:MAG: transcriptional regulator [Halobacteriales archaeon QS_1_68_20]
MPKYSTGGASGGDDGDACELCGASTDSLRRASVEGAELLVCSSCAPHADPEPQREQRSTGTASGADNGGDGGPKMGSSELWDRDSSHWEEEGTDYESDPLPYLVTNYGDRLVEARQEAGLQREELADQLGVPEEDLLAVEQGRGARAGVGGSVVEAIEEALDVTLTER